MEPDEKLSNMSEEEVMAEFKRDVENCVKRLRPVIGKERWDVTLAALAFLATEDSQELIKRSDSQKNGPHAAQVMAAVKLEFLGEALVGLGNGVMVEY